MKITILTDEYPPLIGGAGIVAQQIGHELLKAKHSVFIFKPKRNKAIIFKLFWPFYYFKITLIKKLYTSDKIIVNDLRSAYFISLLSLFIPSILKKCVYILHGTEYDIVYNSSLRNKFILLPLLYNRFLKKVKKIISVSKFTKSIFLSNCPIADKIKKKVNVSYCGISDEIKKINFKDDKDGYFKLVSVSRLEKRKGYIEMFSIFKKIIEIKPKTLWYIYGDGKLRNTLEDLIKENNLQNNVFLMGAMDRLSIYRDEFQAHNFDLFWLLPNMPEAFGLVYVEASMTGVPSLGINNYGITESVDELYYSDLESLFLLMDDIQKRKYVYYCRALKFGEKFNVTNFINSLLN